MKRNVLLCVIIVLLGLGVPILAQLSSDPDWSPCTVFTDVNSNAYVNLKGKRSDTPSRDTVDNVQDNPIEWLRRKSRNSGRADIEIPLEMKRASNGPDVSDLSAECTKVQVPLERDNNNSNTMIGYFVKRIFNNQIPTKVNRQIWLNQGGPGGNGVAMEYIAYQLARLFPDSYIYIPDHRGTGRSTLVDCLADEEPTACQTRLFGIWDTGIRGFRTTEAAKDLIDFMKTMKEVHNQTEIVLYGVSYGTYLVNRLLQIDPQLTDVNIIDGVAPPAFGWLNHVKQRVDDTGRVVLNKCGADDFCSEKLSSDPIKYAEDLYAKIDAGHCSEYVDSKTAKTFLTFVGSFEGLASAVLYRLNRCEAKDKKFLDTLLTALSGTPETTPPKVTDSTFIFYLITFPELYDAAVTTTTLFNDERDSVFWALYGEGLIPIYDAWTLSYSDPYIGGYAPANTRGRLLMLNSDQDFQTPHSWAQHYFDNSPIPEANKRFLTIPNAGHGTVINNRMLTDKYACAMQMFEAWVKNPSTATTSHPCFADIAPIDFTGQAFANLVGAPGLDIYEDGAGSGANLVHISHAFVAMLLALLLLQ